MKSFSKNALSLTFALLVFVVYLVTSYVWITEGFIGLPSLPVIAINLICVILFILILIHET